MNTLLLATRNAGKVKEISEILKNLHVRIRSLMDFAGLPQTVEDGLTLEENALNKARAGFKQTGIPSLGDDSGLEVFHLNGKPGVYSARYAGDRATFDDNNKKLLDALQGVQSDRRRAQFRCVVAFVAEGIEKVVEGACSGIIAEQPRGNRGFGYDPIFVPGGFHETFGEMLPDIKNQISHRGKALAVIKEFLQQYYQRRS